MLYAGSGVGDGMLTQLRTERVLTKLVAGLPLTQHECLVVRPYLVALLETLAYYERIHAAESQTEMERAGASR